MSNENEIVDLNAPITEAEKKARWDSLTDEQKADARRQQVDAALLNPTAPPRLGDMSQAEFLAYCRRFGF